MLDLLGDLGGLAGALTMGCGVVIACLQNESSYQFIMDDMFVERREAPLDSSNGLKKRQPGGRRTSFSKAQAEQRFKRKNDV